MYSHAIVIPTCGNYETLTAGLPRFFEHASKEVIIILSINPVIKVEAERALKMITAFYDGIDGDKPAFDHIWSDKAIGFGNAVNKGIDYLREKYGITEFITIANDDLLVTEDWLTNLELAFSAKEIVTVSTLTNSQNNPKRDISFLNGKIGMTGPTSNGVFNDQRAYNADLLNKEGLDRYAKSVSITNSGHYIPTSFLSGFCITFTKECLEDLCDESFNYNGIFDTRFKVGGFEDDDLAHRALIKGWRQVISVAVFVGHAVSSTLNLYFEGQRGGVANWVDYLLKWEDYTQKEPKIIGAYRVSLKCVNDLNQLRASLVRAGDVLDGVGFVLTNNPKEIVGSFDNMFISHLPPDDQAFLEKCKLLPDDIKECSNELNELLNEWLTNLLSNTERDMDVACKVWTEVFNERDERNLTHELSESLNSDWIISIDADEIFEDRLTRKHLVRIVTNPNPSRFCYNVGFLNHWESMKLLRQDSNYGQQTGARLWRSFPSNPRIVGGNEVGFHCGNSPEQGNYCRRISGIRMRHLSHVRQIDRHNKYEFYSKTDTDKQVAMIGAQTYQHIVKSDNVVVSLYNPNNGIAFFMLCYEQEDWINITRWLDQVYSVADKLVLTWTGEWDLKDRAWIENMGSIKDLSEKDFNELYKTGPRWHLAQVSRLFKVEWVYSKFDYEKGLAECRNSAINHIHDTNDGTLGWCWFMDPDETAQDIGVMSGSALTIAQTSDNIGYMFKFLNPTGDSERPANSESIRLFKLDPNRSLQMEGRVHESFEASLKKIRTENYIPNIDYFPGIFINSGLSQSPERMAEKLLKYRDLLVVQLKDDMYDTGAWVSLGLQYLNDDDIDNAEHCYDNALKCAGGAYLPFKEYGIHCLRKAVVLLQESHRRSNSSVDFHKLSEEMISTLIGWDLSMPIVNTGGISISDTTIMPEFIDPSKAVENQSNPSEEAINEIIPEGVKGS